jgi:hypothetical protein
LYFDQVACRGKAQDYLPKRRGKRAELPEVFAAETIARDMTETAVPGRDEQVRILVVGRQR